MADPDRDERVTQAYRALGGEAPPAALDAAILAAARRRGVRWRAPVAAAAALVLAVGVALVVQREESRMAEEEVALAPRVMDAPSPAASAREPGSSVLAEAGKPAERESRAKDQVLLRRSAPAAEDDLRVQGARVTGAEDSTPIGESPGVPAAGRADEKQAAAARQSASPALAGAIGEKVEAKPETPEQWLERIAKLREANRQKEADESLAEFRRRYPEYEIPEAMRKRVLPR